MRKQLINYLPFILVFLLTFLIYASNAPLNYIRDLKRNDYRNLATAGDVIPNTFLPLLLIKHQTFTFDEISFHLRRFDSGNPNPVFLIRVGESRYSVYPVFSGIMAIPVYFVPLMFNKIPDLAYHENLLKMLLLGRITACLYSAATVAIFYLCLKKLSSYQRQYNYWCVVFTVFFALGTAMWSISSRGMWQHTIAGFFICLAILFLLYARERPNYVSLVGLFLGFAVLARPTNVILVAVISIYVFLHHKPKFITYCLAGFPSVVFLLAYNYFVFGSVFSEGYSTRNDISWSTPLITGLSGFMTSPARSFLLISPPLVFGLFGILKSFTDSGFGGYYNKLYRYMGVGFLMLLFLFSKWWSWSGANGFGYRMVTELLPIIGLLSFEVVRQFKKIGKFIVSALIVYSALVHFNAVFFLRSRCAEKDNWTVTCITPKYLSVDNWWAEFRYLLE